MKKQVIFLLFFLIVALLISGCTTTQVIKNTGTNSSGKTGEVIVTKIIDGDTVVIQGGDHVRLLGIDTPEKGQPFYTEASDALYKKVFMKTVILEKETEDRDQYGRLLRWIWLNDSLINLEMVKEGFAVSRFYENSKYQKEIQEAEQNAINQRLGEWVQLDLDIQENSTTNPKTNSSTSIYPNTDACISLGCPSGTQYVASKNSDVYHSCSCHNAKRIKPENLVCFSSQEDAEKSRSLASCG